MKIVVVDGYTLNPGDLSWNALSSLGECEIHERSNATEVVERANDAEIILTNKALLPRESMEKLESLRYVGVTATGYNIVDVEAAAERGIPVANVPDYGSASVAQMTFAHILNLCQRVGHHADAVNSNRWTECPDFCFWDHPLIELQGLTLGIIGYGNIGQQVGRIARGFGMNLLVYSPSLEPGDEPEPGVTVAEVKQILRESDIVTLHCPLTTQNEHFINKDTLGLMKSTALLVNTGRGPLIDEQALADALNCGGIAGAGLDVLGVEPAEPDNPLISASNCFITPHIAWATRAARKRLVEIAVANVRAFLDGKPRNVVNGAQAKYFVPVLYLVILLALG